MSTDFNFDPESHWSADDHAAHGDLYRQNGMFKKAVEHYTKEEKLREQEGKAGRNKMLLCKLNKSQSLHNMLRFKDVVKTLTGVIPEYEDRFGARSIEAQTAHYLWGAALWRNTDGPYEQVDEAVRHEALRHLLSAREIAEGNGTDFDFSSCHLHLATGELYLFLRNPQEGAVSLAKMISIRRQFLANPEEDTLLAHAHLHLGMACLVMDLLQEAETNLELTQSIAKKHAGRFDIDMMLAHTADALATAYFKLNKIAKAIDCLAEGLNDAATQLGKDHERTKILEKQFMEIIVGQARKLAQLTLEEKLRLVEHVDRLADYYYRHRIPMVGHRLFKSISDEFKASKTEENLSVVVELEIKTAELYVKWDDAEFAVHILQRNMEELGNSLPAGHNLMHRLQSKRDEIRQKL